MILLSPETIEATAAAVSAGVAVVGAILVGLEYVSRQRETRFERAAELEARLTLDPPLRFAMTLLDWGAGVVPIPEEYRAFTGKDALEHDLNLLHAALRPKLSAQIEASRDGTMYRLIFVALFDYLERVIRLWRRDYLGTENLPQTQWLAAQLVRWPYARLGGHSPAEWFLPAMKERYPAVDDGLDLGHLVVEFDRMARAVDATLLPSTPARAVRDRPKLGPQ